VPGNDIDTDRIIPARFMKCITFDGLGEFLFYDVRKDSDGNDVPHPLNEERFKGATILLSGANFGCGSSREHAPQAIQKYGFRGVIAENFAEIFFGNSTTLGMPCATVTREDIAKVVSAVEADPTVEVTIDVEAQVVRFGDQSVPAEIRGSARDGLLNGRWDAIAELHEGVPQVKETAAKLPYMAA
jgi:3-isopropylmalate/(R)-2-methylmalate dehydratase small subunit